MQIKENIKSPRHWPLCGEFTGDRWIPRIRASNSDDASIWCHHYATVLRSTCTVAFVFNIPVDACRWVIFTDYLVFEWWLVSVWLQDDIDTSGVHVGLWQWSQWAQSSKLYAKWSNRVGNISQTGHPFIQIHTKRCLTFVFGVILVHCDKRNPRYTFKRVRDQPWLVTCPDMRHAITWTNAKCCQYDPAEHNIQWECKHSCGNMCKIVVNYFRQQYVQRSMRDNVARLYCMNFARLRGDILSLSLGCILLIFTTMKIISYFGGKYFAYGI